MSGAAIEIKRPDIPKCNEFSTLEKLNKEKELIGIYLSAHPLDDYRLELNYYCNTRIKELEDLTIINKREVTIGGMITAKRRGTSKKGNEYAIFTIEDYSGPFELPLFGDDMNKFFGIVDNNKFVMIRGMVGPKKFNPAEKEFKINQISFLGDAKSKKIDCITLSIPLPALTASLVTELTDLTRSDEGDVLLKFNIYDPTNNNQIRLFSRSKKVTISNDLVKYFEDTPDITFTLDN